MSATSWSQRLLAAFFAAAGTLHFLRPKMYEEIMPRYLPGHHELVLASGAAEIAGAIAVLPQRTRRLAGLWLAATLVAVFPANVHMALHAERYPGFAARAAVGPIAASAARDLVGAAGDSSTLQPTPKLNDGLSPRLPPVEVAGPQCDAGSLRRLETPPPSSSAAYAPVTGR